MWRGHVRHAVMASPNGQQLMFYMFSLSYSSPQASDAPNVTCWQRLVLAAVQHRKPTRQV